MTQGKNFRPRADQILRWLAARGKRTIGGGTVGLNAGLPQITQRYLNTAAYAGDPTPGAVVSTSEVSGSIVQTYGGFVGQITPLGKDAANYLSDPGAQQLYAGDYQYVQFDPNGANPAVQGQVVFWLDNTSNLLPGGGFIVTCVESTAQLGLIAGIALANTAAGNYWFIQVAGIAQVKFATAQGVASPAVGDLVFADYSTPSNLAYDPVQSTDTLTLAQLKAVLGVLWATVVISKSPFGPVMLGGLSGPKYYPGGGGGEG
jgi:hypothetical protein